MAHELKIISENTISTDGVTWIKSSLYNKATHEKRILINKNKSLSSQVQLRN
jgi:hypothetical protein